MYINCIVWCKHLLCTKLKVHIEKHFLDVYYQKTENTHSVMYEQIQKL